MRDCQVQRPRFFRVRERDGWEIRIRIGLLGNQSDIGEAGFFQDLLGECSAYTVHSRQSNPQVRLAFRASRGQRGCAGNVVFAGIHVDDELIILCNLIGKGSRRNRRGDLCIKGRNDLDALTGIRHDCSAQIDLVAVVARRIVRGGHHDSRICIQLAHRESSERGWVHQGKQEHLASRCRGHTRSRVSKVNRTVAGIASDDDTRSARSMLKEHCTQARRRTDNNRKVHPRLAGTDLTTQASGTELQGTIHGTCKFEFCVLIAFASGLDQ